MISLLLERKWNSPAYTVGRFYVEGGYFGNSMEGADRGMDKAWPLKTIELGVSGNRTAIPTGTYMVKLVHTTKFASQSWSKRYKDLVPEVQDVPGFSGVYIRPLNSAMGAAGSIGIGENRHRGRLSYTTKYYYDLMANYLYPAHIRGDAITLTIR